MYTLDFVDDEEGQRNYELSFQAIAMTQKELPLVQWDDAVALVRKMKAVGKPAAQKIGRTQLYDLKAGGGQVLLERSEYTMLFDMVTQPIWRPMALEDVQAVLEWLKAHKNDGGSLVQDARPEAKRRAGLELANGQ